MWIDFTSRHAFAVKVCFGGVNAVSGECAVESPETHRRRQEMLAKGKPIQDYVVTGRNGQLWLDGIAKLDGKVMQFVATPAGDGYSVEAQITGADAFCGIQIEVIPSVTKVRADAKIFVITETGKRVNLIVDLTKTVRELRATFTTPQVLTSLARD